VYGGARNELPTVIRRLGVRGVLGEDLLGVLAANVNTLGSSEPADCGGVNVNAVAVGLVSVAGCDIVGVRLGNADLGVSGYVIENGPGVCVR
jgi:hypothetical protein